MNKDFVIVLLFGIMALAGYLVSQNLNLASSPRSVTRTDKPEPSQITTDNPSAANSDASISCSRNPLPELTEGPYFLEGSPRRQDIRDDADGTLLILEGYVLDTNCKPIPGAWIDFWQADGRGEYDLTGFTLRGHQATDESGRYKLFTVVPGEYLTRTEHIHFKIKATENSRVITSQLFLPNAERNTTDSIFDPALIIDMRDAPDGGKSATYNFVVAK